MITNIESISNIKHAMRIKRIILVITWLRYECAIAFLQNMLSNALSPAVLLVIRLVVGQIKLVLKQAPTSRLGIINIKLIVE